MESKGNPIRRFLYFLVFYSNTYSNVSVPYNHTKLDVCSHSSDLTSMYRFPLRVFAVPFVFSGILVRRESRDQITLACIRVCDDWLISKEFVSGFDAVIGQLSLFILHLNLNLAIQNSIELHLNSGVAVGF